MKRFTGSIVVWLLPLLLATLGIARPGGSAGALDSGKIQEAYGRLPLAFEPNRGQAPPEVRFLSRGKGCSLFLTGTDAILALRNPDCGMRIGGPGGSRPAAAGSRSGAVVRMRLVGGSTHASVTGTARTSGVSNYYIGNDPRRWRVGVANYSGVRYEGVYPGIDLVYHGDSHGDARQIEYDFIVAPGADPGRIALNFTGAADPYCDGKGNLVLETAAGDLCEHKPVVYQEIAGKRREVSRRLPAPAGDRGWGLRRRSLGPGAFFPHDEGAAPNAFLPPTPCIPHPRLLSPRPVRPHPAADHRPGPLLCHVPGRIGRRGGERHRGRCHGQRVRGREYNSPDFPVVGSIQSSQGGNLQSSDVFVARLNQTGTALVYSTYIGGVDTDVGNGIAVDSAGYAYVTGGTSSWDFPVDGIPLNRTPPLVDSFVLRLDPHGRLLYSSFLGGDYNQALGIAVDSLGDAYITGWTGQGHLPVTPNAFQANFKGGNFDGFVAKLSASGHQLRFCSYLGGGGNDYGLAITVDQDEKAYVTGTTASFDFPVPPVAYQRFLQGATNVFLAKVDTIQASSGGTLAYATFLGGSGRDYGTGIALDQDGSIYLAGYTSSGNFPVTPGAYRTTPYLGGTFHAFVTKFRVSGVALAYSTFLGGSRNDVNSPHGSPAAEWFSVVRIALDGAKRAWVAGSTQSPDFPVTAETVAKGGFPSDPGHTATMGFVTRLNASGSRIEYSTLLRGSTLGPSFINDTGDEVRGIALDGYGSAYVAGYASSLDFPTPTNAYQRAPKYLPADALIAKLGYSFFWVTPSTLPGGTTLTAIVTLLAPAPAGGKVVTFTSSNPSVAQVPAPITIAAGQTTASVLVHTGNVTTDTSVTIAAAASGYTTTPRVLTVQAFGVATIALTPNVVCANQTRGGVIQLSRPAPSNGAVVALVSSTARIIVPPTVKVPAGQFAATFTYQTAKTLDRAAGTYTITAAYNGTHKSAVLNFLGPQLLGMDINPRVTPGGASGTVYLTCPPPQGSDVFILLSSTNSAVEVPAMVRIPPGSPSVNFPVMSHHVTVPVRVRISAAASWYPRTLTGYLILTP